MNNPLKVAITGAAGQLAYALLFRLANGGVFGYEQPLELHLLEIPSAMGALEGVAMELDDCAFPLLQKIEVYDQPEKAFNGINWGLLIGSKPRGAGMKRADLLAENGRIFVSQGRALLQANQDVQILVVGNPANTNCLIALSNANDISPERFHAMTRLDHNRALAQLASKAGVPVKDVNRMTIWGNHSATQFPDFYNARIQGNPVANVIKDQNWLENDFIKAVQQRGTNIIEARGLSSAASAANAVIDHVLSMLETTDKGNWLSSAVYSQGQYDCPKGVVSSFPIVSEGQGKWSILESLTLPPFAIEKLVLSFQELEAEKALVQDLIPT